MQNIHAHFPCTVHQSRISILGLQIDIPYPSHPYQVNTMPVNLTIMKVRMEKCYRRSKKSLNLSIIIMILLLHTPIQRNKANTIHFLWSLPSGWCNSNKRMINNCVKTNKKSFEQIKILSKYSMSQLLWVKANVWNSRASITCCPSQCLHLSFSLSLSLKLVTSCSPERFKNHSVPVPHRKFPFSSPFPLKENFLL